jgi:6-phosphogluconate dehydrogenase
MKKIIGYIGLGKMGLNMVKRLRKAGYEVVAFDNNPLNSKEAKKVGAKVTDSISNLVELLPKKKVVFVMVPHKAVSSVLSDLNNSLSKGDIVIDGGNSNFKESIGHESLLNKKGIYFLDAGVSGGPGGALNGACVMVGGNKKAFDAVKEVFKAISLKDGYLYLGKSGSGHFAKMIHNGIEYGMMQSIAEGFAILKKSGFKYDLNKLTGLYNKGSVIESRLIGWLGEAFKIYGEDLKDISGVVAHTGEADWTVEVAKTLNIETPAIDSSLQFRKNSISNPSDYKGKVLSALRNRFGGHRIKS